MSQHTHRIRTVDDSELDVTLDRYEDLLTHETDVALVVREDDRLCMCLDLETARQLGQLLIELSDQASAPRDVDPAHAA